ncbi:MAG: hypothetical protein ACXWUG_07865 [Polyangiales bacterium]
MPFHTDGVWADLFPLTSCPQCKAVFAPSQVFEPTDEQMRSTRWVTDSMAMQALEEGCDRQTEIAVLLRRWHRFNQPLHLGGEPLYLSIPLATSCAFAFVAHRLAVLGCPLFAGYEAGWAWLFAAITAWCGYQELAMHRRRRRQRLRYLPGEEQTLDTYRDARMLEANAFRAILVRLDCLLDRDDRVQRLLAAEVARELGRFDEAIALVGRDASPWAATIAAESRERRRFVTAVRR